MRNADRGAGRIPRPRPRPLPRGPHLVHLAQFQASVRQTDTSEDTVGEIARTIRFFSSPEIRSSVADLTREITAPLAPVPPILTGRARRPPDPRTRGRSAHRLR